MGHLKFNGTAACRVDLVCAKIVMQRRAEAALDSHEWLSDEHGRRIGLAKSEQRRRDGIGWCDEREVFAIAAMKNTGSPFAKDAQDLREYL